jgi:hypothetical protein
MTRRPPFLGILGVFGRSEDLRALDRALRAADLHPALVPDAVKLTFLTVLKDALGETPRADDYRQTAMLFSYCVRGPEAFASANGDAASSAVEQRIEAALETGEGLDANLILLALHAAIIHPGVKEAYRLESD